MRGGLLDLSGDFCGFKVFIWDLCKEEEIWVLRDSDVWSNELVLTLKGSYLALIEALLV